MKVKFSKRLLSAFLSLMLVVTSVPMFALTASAAEDVTVKTVVADWDYTESFNSFTDTPPVTDTVNGLTMSGVVWGTEWSYQNGGAYNSDGYLYTDSLGTVLGDASGVDINASFMFTSVNSSDGYGFISVGESHDSSFNNILYITVSGDVYYNGSQTGVNIGAPVANVKYDVHIILIGTDLDLYVNGTKYDITSSCAYTASQFNHVALGVQQDSYYPASVVYNLRAYAYNTVSVDGTADNLKNAISIYENAMSHGLVYTNMSAAYDAYVTANEAYDAVYYGGRTDIDLAAVAKDLLTAVSNMEVWTPYSGTVSTSGYLNNDSTCYVPTEYQSNLLYVGYCTGDLGTSNRDNNNVDKSITAYLQYPEVTMLYDGKTQAQSGICMVIKSSNGNRQAYSMSIATDKDTSDIKNLSLVQTWRGNQGNGGNWDYDWIIEQTGEVDTVSASDTDTSSTAFALSNKSTGFANVMKFTGTSSSFGDSYYLALTPTVTFYGGSNSTPQLNDIIQDTTSSMPVYVINYKALIDAVDTAVGEITKYVNGEYSNSSHQQYSFSQGHLASLLKAVDNATSYDPNSAFTSSNDYTSCASQISSLASAISNAEISDSNEYYEFLYQILSGTGNLGATTDVNGNTAKGAYESNGDGYDMETWNIFSIAYRAVIDEIQGLYQNGYTSYDSSEGNDRIFTLADNVLTTFQALTKSTVEVEKPTITGASLLGPEDKITFGVPEGEGAAGKIGDSTIIIIDGISYAPFSSDYYTGGDTITVTAYATKVENDVTYSSAYVTNTYTYFKAPSLSKDNNSIISSTDTVEITTGMGTQQGTLQYSYDGQTWSNYTGAFAPFDGEKENELSVTLYIREQATDDSGITSTSEVASYTLFADVDVAVYAVTNGVTSTDTYSSDSTFKIESEASTIYYTVAVDGGAPGAFTAYNQTSGISASAYASNTVVEIKVYAIDGAETSVGSAMFINSAYDTLVYHESFDDATVSGNDLTSSSGNATLENADTAEVLEGYAPDGLDGNGNSADYRENVLHITGSTKENRNTITFNTNPLTSTSAGIVAKSKGVTISFWRAYPASVTPENWEQLICFGKDSSFEGTNSSEFYYFEINGTGTSSFNYGDGNGNSSDYYDFIYENQDPTTHAAGNNTYHWMNVVVTIDPTSGVMVYTNGEPHNVTSEKQCGGAYADFENDAELAQDIIAYLTASDTDFTLIDGDVYNQSVNDVYVDDIRIYTDTLTQVDINNMYADGDFPDAYNNASTGHDPTAVTVYTLAGGTYTSTDSKNTVTESAGKTVGQEFIDYYGIDATDKTQVTDIDYYIFGTGMTIYHSDDNVSWEVVGDSMGRCGYQNTQLYGGVYTTAIAEQLAFASHSDYTHAGTNTWQQPSEGAGYLQWAPHVMYNINSDCWQYYGSTSSWGSMDSCIFTGNSQSVVGPYENIKTVFASCADYAGTTTPGNAIDSCVYYGHNSDGTINPDELYMLYGSWQPTYVIKLDPTTGQNVNYDSADPYGTTSAYATTPDADGYYYYGKIICAANPKTDGNGSGEGSGEGGYMIYQNGYYYLYVSLGSNRGNYNLRVFRSTEPDSGFAVYSGQEATDTSATVHGMSFLSSYYLPIYDYVYTSVGHNSVYKAVNNYGKVVTVDSAHARTFSTSSSSNGLVGMQDGGMITRQVDLTGNISIQNMIAYTNENWQVAFPLQYNGTDTTVNTDASGNIVNDGYYTADDIKGVYTVNNLLTAAAYSYADANTLTINSTSETEALVYSTSIAKTLTLSYGTDYAGDPVTYIDIEGLCQGVVGQQVIDGEVVTEISWFRLSADDNHMFTWGYRTDEIPAVDQESAGDIVQHSGVIYTHLENEHYSMYGREISDNFTYGQTGSTGERCTTITTTYPYVIDTDSTTAIYSLTSEKLAEQGYVGGSFNAVDIYGCWYDEDGNAYTDAEAAEVSSSKTLTKTYGLTGMVSSYFEYGNGEDGGYPETGVQLLITYSSLADGKSYGEYEYFYVQPNPCLAHEVTAMRNQDYTNAAVSSGGMRTAVTAFSRFVGSYGTESGLRTTLTTYNADSTETTASSDSSSLPIKGGTGVFKYASSFGSDESVNDDYTTPLLVSQMFNFYEPDEALNSGAYCVAEIKTSNDNASVAADVINADYYIDYSDTSDSLITRNGNGTPTGYELYLLVSNYYWNPVDGNVQGASSYAVNKTGLDVSYQTNYTADTANAVATGTNSNIENGGFGYRYGASSSPAPDIYEYFKNIGYDDAFDYIDNSWSATNSWQGTAVFTGKDSVKRSADTTSAESYANYILETGLYTKSSYTLGGSWYTEQEVYNYYNLGVSTCDKGAVRDFLETYVNKTITTVYDDDGNMYLVPGDAIESGKYTVASYQAYLDAIAEAYWFIENEQNTTYNGTGSDAQSAGDNTGEYEYVTAYRTEGEEIACTDADGNEYTVDRSAGTPIYDSSDLGTGTDIFGEGSSVNTDPVQTMIIDNIVKAYQNLFEVSTYADANTAYTKALDFINSADTANMTSASVQAYTDLLEKVSADFNYYTDNETAADDEVYWRYTELTKEDYDNLKKALADIQKTLMPKVTTDEVDTAINDAETNLGEGIYDENSVQTKSLSSWLDLYGEKAYAEDYMTAEYLDSPKYTSTQNEYTMSSGTTYTIDVVDEQNEANYSDEQKWELNEADTLNAMTLKNVDTADAYEAYDAAAEVINTLDRDRYTPEGLVLLDAYYSQFTTGIVNSLAVKPNDASCTSVYYTPSDAEKAAYEAATGSAITDTTLKYTSINETDLFTASILNLANTLNESYVNGYTAYLVVNDIEGNRTTTEKSLSYGEIAQFDVSTYASGNAVEWNVALYANGYSEGAAATETFDVKSYNMSNYSRRVVSDMVVTATVTSNTDTANTVTVNIYDAYGTIVDILYTSTAPTIGKYAELTVNGDVVSPKPIPFYTFTRWSVQQGDDENTINAVPTYDTGNKLNITLDTSSSTAAITGDTYEDGLAEYNTKVTVSSTLDDFAAWAVKTSEGYQIVSYSPDYTFYACVDETYVEIMGTDSDSDGVYESFSAADGTVLTADNVVNSKTAGSTGSLTNDEFLVQKLNNKDPFVYIQTVKVYDSNTKARVYARVTEGCGDYTSLGVEFTLDGTDYKRTVSSQNILSSNQFTYTLSKAAGITSFSARAFVRYNFNYSYQNTETTTDVTASIAAVDYTPVVDASVSA